MSETDTGVEKPGRQSRSRARRRRDGAKPEKAKLATVMSVARGVTPRWREAGTAKIVDRGCGDAEMTRSRKRRCRPWLEPVGEAGGDDTSGEDPGNGNGALLAGAKLVAAKLANDTFRHGHESYSVEKSISSSVFSLFLAVEPHNL